MMERLHRLLNNKKVVFAILALIIIGAFFARLYKFHNPIADWHSWRQADTSAVSRWYVEHGIDLLHPKYEDISNIPSGKDNPMGYRMVEFPIYNATVATLTLTIGHFTVEEWGRLVTIIVQLFGILFVYLLVKRHANNIAGLFAAFFFAFLPFNIYYGRTILPDPSMAVMTLGGIYFFDLWTEKTKNYAFLILSLIFINLALLLKPYALFWMLPTLFLAYRAFGSKLLVKWQLWLYAILAVIPLGLWRVWIQQYPEGIPVSAWLFNEGNIRFKGAYFYWLFADRIGRLISGYWGLSLLGFGLISKIATESKQKFSENWFFVSFLVSSLAYLVVIARGNVQHDYYQILIVPTIAIYMGLGASFLLNLPKQYFSQIAGAVVLIIATIFSLFFGWYFIRDYYNINNPAMIIAGQTVRQLTPPNAKVIANLEGDTSFLYQTDRQGWPAFEKGPEELAKTGADYMVLLDPSGVDPRFAKEFKVIAQTSQYIIYNLHETP